MRRVGETRKTADAAEPPLDTSAPSIPAADALLRAISDSIPQLIFAKDCEGRLLMANAATCRLVGLPLEAMLGRRDSEYNPVAEIGAEIVAHDLQVARTGETLVTEERWRCADGDHTFLVTKSPLRDAEGRIVGVVGIAIDIEDRARFERAVRSSEAHFRAIADSVPAKLWTTDASGCCTYLSRRWTEFTGRAMQAGLGLGWLDIVHPEDVDRVRHVVLDAHARRESFRFDYRLRRHDGEYRWVVEAGNPRYEGGRFVGFAGVVVDVHERKVAEHALAEADRRKDEFLATLAHELRSPLAPIRNAVQVLKLKGPPDPELRASRAVIDRQVTQMARLLDDLLDVSRITLNRLRLRRSRMPLAAAIEAAVETSRPLIAAAGHRLAVTLPPPGVEVDGDAVRLAQVFANLLNNAAKYTDPGGSITLHAEARDGEAVVTVRDTGIGIAAEQLPQLFRMFAQAAPALERAQGGLGIGLALVRGLVEMHGGTVEARSDGIGCGAEFEVRLPLAGGTRSDDTGSAASSVARADRKRVLVADDNRDAADSLAALVAAMGGEVVGVVYDGAAAFEAVRERLPDLVFLDIGMPRLNGYEVAQRIRAAGLARRPMLVALTGWGQDEDKRRAYAAGFDRHLTKPLEPEALQALLAEERVVPLRHAG